MLKESKNGVFKKTIQLIFVALLAKVLGFIREMVLANYYGTSYVSDVFIAVQNIPSIIFTVFGTAVTTGFIPIYSSIEVKQGKKQADMFANNLFNIFLVISVVLTFLGTFFSKQLVLLFAGGFKGETLDLCNQFAKIIMPTSIAIILVYIYNAYLQIEGYFNQNSLMNVPYNIFQIIFIALGFYMGNNYILAVGLLVASYSQLIYLRFLVHKRTKFKHKKYIKFNDTYIKQMLLLVGPVFISTGVNQINSIVDKSLASGLIEGSVSALNYSGEISNIVIQVIILSLTTILYPQMAKLFAEKDNEKEKNEFIEKFLNIVTIIVLPLTMLIFIFSKEIVQVLFARGAFGAKNVEFVGNALKVYAIGIIGASFRDVINKIFYSMKNTIIPMINGIISVVFNIVLNLILIKKYKYLGLAFATSISSIICTFLMFIQLTKKVRDIRWKKILMELIKSVLAVIIMYAFYLFFNKVIILNNTLFKCLIQVFLLGIIYIATLILFKNAIICNYLKKYSKR